MLYTQHLLVVLVAVDGMGTKAVPGASLCRTFMAQVLT